MKIVKQIICSLFGLFMIYSGSNKIFQYIPMPELTEEQIEMIGHFMAISWLMPLIGLSEMVGGLLFILPKYRALGALVMLPITTGIILHHIVLEPAMPGLGIGIAVFAINIWILFDNWDKYKPIWS